MARIEELDHLMETDSAGIVGYEDEAALSDRIGEWCETPQGTVADLPGWGNRFAYMKHEPPGIDLEIMAEMDVIEKLPVDIKNLVVTGIVIEFREIDLLYIGINHYLGNFSSEVSL